MLRSLFQILSRWWGRRRPAVVVKPRRVRLQVEALEDRWVPSTIAGYVYHDPTNDGTYQVGSGISGQKVDLEDQNGTFIESATTDSTGHYSFSNLPPSQPGSGTITQTVTFPSQTTGSSWTTGQLATPTQPTIPPLNQFDPNLGTLTEVDITSNGTLVSDFKFENEDGSSPTVTGTVSETLNLSDSLGVLLSNAITANPDTKAVGPFDGVVDYGGTSGFTFPQQTTNGSAQAQLTPPAPGSTQPNPLTPFTGTGHISLTQKATSGLALSGAPGNGDYKDTANAASTITIVYHYTPTSVLPPGHYKVFEEKTPDGYFDDKETVGHHLVDVDTTTGDKLNVNFGAVKPASLSGYDYYDAGNTGIMQAGSGINGVTINLTGTDDTGAAVSLTASTGTNGPAGFYQFQNLRPGSYTLTQATTPATYINGIDTGGSQGATPGHDSSGNPTLSQITLSDSTAGINNNFGEVKPGSLSGTVFADTNNDGIQELPGDIGLSGVSVELTGTTSNGQVITPEFTTTDGNGLYSFGNLLPGTYQIAKQNTPTGYIDGIDTIGSLNGTLNGSVFSQIHLPSNTSGVNYNYAEVKVSTLSGFVYDDANNDGVKDSGEQGISGVTLQLTGTVNGKAITPQTVKTKDSSGAYAFPNLMPGSYSITKLNTPTGYIDGKDTLGDPTNGTVTENHLSNITLTGTDIPNNNFGEIKESELSGHVYLDKNNNGIMDPGEKGIKNVKIILTGTDANNNPVNFTTFTNASGFYQFPNSLDPNLLGGDYTITKVPPKGYLDGKQHLGTAGGTIGKDTFVLSLPLESSGDQYDFGELRPPSPPPSVVANNPKGPPTGPFIKGWAIFG